MGLASREAERATLQGKIEYATGLARAAAAWDAGSLVNTLTILCVPTETGGWAFSANLTYDRAIGGVIGGRGEGGGLVTSTRRGVARPAAEVRAELRELARRAAEITPEDGSLRLVPKGGFVGPLFGVLSHARDSRVLLGASSTCAAQAVGTE